MVFLHCIGCKATIAQVPLKDLIIGRLFVQYAQSCRKLSMIGQPINVFTAT